MSIFEILQNVLILMTCDVSCDVHQYYPIFFITNCVNRHPALLYIINSDNGNTALQDANMLIMWSFV